MLTCFNLKGYCTCVLEEELGLVKKGDVGIGVACSCQAGGQQSWEEMVSHGGLWPHWQSTELLAPLQRNVDQGWGKMLVLWFQSQSC